ncbi:Membrane protein insertase YidC [Trichinella pseudospiralis]
MIVYQSDTTTNNHQMQAGNFVIEFGELIRRRKFSAFSRPLSQISCKFPDGSLPTKSETNLRRFRFRELRKKTNLSTTTHSMTNGMLTKKKRQAVAVSLMAYAHAS